LSRIENQKTQATLGTRHRPNATKQKQQYRKQKIRETWTLPKNGSEPRCSGRVTSSCF